MVMPIRKEPHNQGNMTNHKRSGHSKVRTGCITCKVRRVKCDKGKPGCLRCIKFGRECDGYFVPKAETKNKPRPLYTNLQPKPRPVIETEKETVPVPKKKISRDRRDVTVIFQPRPTGVSFENADEYRYFKLFAEKTAKRLSGHVDPLLWTQKILQASEREHALRHAVIAIGALDLTSEMGVYSKLEGARSANVDSHYLFALRQYSKFVKEMQRTVAQNRSDIRTKLLVTLLTFCFEAYLGESDSASSQIHTGVQLIEDWFRQQIQSSEHGSRFTSPAPHIIEDEILHAFDRFSIQLIAGTQRFSLEEHIKLKDQGQDIAGRVPEVFKDCDEARNYGNFQKRRVMHFMSAASLQLGIGADAGVCLADSLKVMPTTAILLEHERHMADFQKWSEAFAPVLARSRTPQGEHEFKPAALLRIHHITFIMTVAQMFSNKETDWDLFHSTFVEIVNLSKLALQEDDYIFTVNLQCVIPLEIVAKKCRDPVLRREALRLLVEKPRRDGLKDSMMSARICTWVIGVEEEGMIDGFVPDEARARDVGASWSFETRILRVWCNLPAVGGESELIRKRRTEIKW